MNYYARYRVCWFYVSIARKGSTCKNSLYAQKKITLINVVIILHYMRINIISSKLFILLRTLRNKLLEKRNPQSSSV